ncbi:MAG: helix-turn-helix domain-containing protein [Bacteroidales bacterium]|nr:helix-turn-helix domain-containing protein [Bacteroidales bacterium]
MAQIRTQREYEAIMARIDTLFFETDENTPADDPRLTELDILSALVEEYESEQFPIAPPTLSEMLIHKMHELNLTQKELSATLGMTAPRLSEILNGKKDPTYRQAQKIAQTLDIDANIVLAI